MPEVDDTFERLMEMVGFNGRFQRMYNWIYISSLTFCGAMIYMNLILALNVPEHWCHVPGMDRTNFTLEKWRTITLPSERDNRGEVKYSSCNMYNVNFTEIQHWDYENWNFSLFETTGCVHGFEYDKQYYERTAVTQEDWVCEKEIYVTNAFVASRITEVIGTCVFGQLGDTVGRRITYYLSVISVMFGRVLSILTTSSYTWFIIATSIASFPINSYFQSAVVVAMEISEDEKRSSIAMQQNMGWSAGTCLIPLIFWWVRDWIPFMWLTTLPTVFIFIFYNYMIESPRWLISKRRFGDAIRQFKKIAKINGRKFDMSEKELSDMYSGLKEEKVYGMMSLFSGGRIARNTAIMGFSWCVVSVSYFTLYLFSSRMGGNPFLNFLLQSVVEVPSYFLGQYFGDLIGRRLTNSFCYLICGFLCVPIIVIAPMVEYEMVVICIVTVIKFLNGVTFFVASIQAMEIYPTCLRQTGLSLGSILGNAVGILAPYFVYLGTSYDIRYPYYILIALFLIGGVSTLFLPETLHQKLPDSLEEAMHFGCDQKFWSLPKKPHKKVADNNRECNVDEDSDLETSKMNNLKQGV